MTEEVETRVVKAINQESRCLKCGEEHTFPEVLLEIINEFHLKNDEIVQLIRYLDAQCPYCGQPHFFGLLFDPPNQLEEIPVFDWDTARRNQALWDVATRSVGKDIRIQAGIVFANAIFYLNVFLEEKDNEKSRIFRIDDGLSYRVRERENSYTIRFHDE